MSFVFYPRKKKRCFVGGASFIYCWKRYALSGDQFRRCMVPSSLLFWSTLSSSRKVSLKVICPEYLGPATWLSKHNSAPQGGLKATGQTGTEGTFATFAAITSSFLPPAKVPIVQGYKEGRVCLGCPCPAPMHSRCWAVGTGIVWNTAWSGHLQELHNLENSVSPS